MPYTRWRLCMAVAMLSWCAAAVASTSNAVAFATFPQPGISGLQPNSGPPGAAITISGQNFGSSQGAGSVTFNGAAAAVASWSDGSIVARVPAGASSGNVVVTAGTTVSSAGAHFAVINPGGVSVDQVVSGGASTPLFSTNAGNELLLAFVAAAPGVLGSNGAIASVAGGNLTWALVQRSNTQTGTAEVWRAFSASPLNNISVTAATSNADVFITVVSFLGVDTSGSNGSGAIGATGTGNALNGFPAVTLTTTRNNSLVFAVGEDPSGAAARTASANQTLVGQLVNPCAPPPPGFACPTAGDTFWVQQLATAVGSSGTQVRLQDTSPNNDPYNLSAVEIRAALSASTAPLITSLSAIAGEAGTAITISGANFGTTPGTVTFNGAAAAPSSWSPSSIVVPVPSGAATGNVIVSVGGQASNGLRFIVASAGGLGIDQIARTLLTSPLFSSTFSTSSGNEVLVALVSTAPNGQTGGPTITPLQGGGLNWVRVENANTQAGTAEVWRAFSPTILSNVAVSYSPGPGTDVAITVVTLLGADPSGTNGSGAIGATAVANAAAGAPTASLTSTRANSLVFGVGDDPSAGVARTAGPNQALLAGIVNNQCSGSTCLPGSYTLWAQQVQGSIAKVGASVTVNDTAPAGDAYNLSIVEVLPSPTPLTITAASSPPANAAGWNNSNVTVTYTCAGGVAPVVCPGPQTVSTEGANQVITGTASDGTGLHLSASVTLNIDKTAPTISAAVTPAANSKGVVTAPATINFTCADSLSGVATCPAAIQVTSAGLNQSFNGTATDRAGNTSAAASLTFSVQTAPLAMVAAPSPAANANGWNNTSVTVSYNCTGGVPPVSCAATQTVSSEGAGQVINPPATDAAGQTTSASVTLNIDKTAPTISAAVTPAPNANNVVTAPATINFTCADSLSGVATCPAAIQVTTAGFNESFSGTATDKAGNTSPASLTFSVQTAPPAIVVSASPAANAAGWNNSNVAVAFTCSGGVAPVTCPSPQTVSTEGANQVISGTLTDAAGQSASASVTLNIDKTPPTISGAVTPAPNANNVVTAPATINFTCADSLSGVATCPAPIQVTTAGFNESFSGTATDKAGNASAPSTVTLNVQTAPLAVSASAAPAPNANGWNNTDVTVTYICSGGVPPVACPAAKVVHTDGANQSISATATDAAGQTASASATVSVDETGPTISAAITPPPNGSEVVTLPATVSFICSDAASGVAFCPPPVPITTVGFNQSFTGTASDKAGNTTSTTLFLNAQAAPLAIVASAAPPPNAAGWNNTSVTISYQCSGGVPPLQCPLPQTVSTDGAGQAITAAASDAVGQTAGSTVTLQIDTTPPLVSITSPTGNVANAGTVVVQGIVSDALSGTSSVSCNGSPATVTGTSFTCSVTFTRGSNTVTVTASDVAGNSATASLTQGVSFPINVKITSPSPLQLFSSNPITVSGTIDTPTATVTAGGVTGNVSNGTFTISGVILREDKNLLTVEATTPDGGVGSATVTVFLDTNAPVVHIDSPVDGASVTTTQIDVAGNVNDLVTGTVNGADVSVVVNGVTATVANRSFVAHGVILVPGANTLTVIATDRAGNTGQHRVHVNLMQLAGRQTLTTVSGNGQNGAIGTVLPQPLVVRATDALGRPMPNVALSFAVAKSDGLILSGQNQGRALVVVTDANGNASVLFQLGSRNGAGINQVAVTAPGFVGPAVFTADSTMGSPTLVHPVSGEMQKGALGAALPEPLTAIVFDSGRNPVPGVPVTFTVRSGSGLIGGLTTFTQNTDNDGKVSAILVLGQQQGVNNNEVDASFPGMSGLPAVFMSSSLSVGLVANTTISGIVLDDADQPIPRATASVKGTNLSAQTDANGRFTIANAPVGDIVLFVDGSTSTAPERYPTLSFQMATLAGIDNTLPGPIFLPEIDAANSQVVGGDQDVVLTMKGVPGVAYKVFAHSVTFPDGSHQGALTLSQVHADKVPMTPPNGTAPRLVGTLQPAGVKFDPPIQLTLPNTDGLAPGQVTEIFSFHHDVEQFVTEGTARVSEDGSVVVSDPGFGLSVSGWHGLTSTSPPSGGAAGKPCQTDASDPLSLTAQADSQDQDFKFVGDTIAFTATPTGHCDGATWDWDFNDNSTHGNIQNPSHTYSQPQLYTVKVHLSCNTSCPNPRRADATVSATAIKLTLKAVSWGGIGQNRMKKTGSGAWEDATFGSEGDTDIVNPVWQAQDDGTVTTNDPVSYVKGSQPSVTPTFKVEPNLTSAVPAVIKPAGDIVGLAHTSTLTFNPTNFSLQGSVTGPPTMTATNAISGVVDDTDAVLHWNVSLDGGSTFKVIDDSDTRTFITWGTPAGYYANPGVTAKRVQRAVFVNAGLTNVTDMASKTSENVAQTVKFAQQTTLHDTTDNHWALLDGPNAGCDCISLAVLAVKHLKMLGISSVKEGRAYPTGGNPPGDTDATAPEMDAQGRTLDYFAAGHPNLTTGIFDVLGDNSFEGFFEVTDNGAREAFTVNPVAGPILAFSGSVSGDKLTYNVIKTTLDSIKARFSGDPLHPHDGRQYWAGTAFDFSQEIPFPVPQ